MSERQLQVSEQDLGAVIDLALNPRPIAPGFISRQTEIARPVPLPPWFIDRCRQVYLSIPAEEAAGHRLIGITSSLHGEGKTEIAIGMAMAVAADTQEPTLLLECDLAEPALSRLFGFQPSPGLGDWLEGASNLRIIRAAPLANLFVIPAGSPPSDPARIFYQLSESKLMAELKPRFENVIIDLPPMLNIAYSSMATKLADRLVLVARYGVTPLDDIEQSVFLLGRERLVGVVLNGTDYKTPEWLRRAF
jgi:Mrp family chromosome partitioning ATPase